MTNREAIAELTYLLREATGALGQSDPVHAAALLRQAERTLSAVEAREHAESELLKAARKDARAGLASLRHRAAAPGRDALPVERQRDIAAEERRVSRKREARDAIGAQLAAAGSAS